jgi:hypothetical protein
MVVKLKQKVDQKYLESFSDVVLKKEGEDQLNRSCGILTSTTNIQGENEHGIYSYKKKKTKEGRLDWSHIA